MSVFVLGSVGTGEVILAFTHGTVLPKQVSLFKDLLLSGTEHSSTPPSPEPSGTTAVDIMRTGDLALLRSVERREVTREKKNAQLGENRVTERSKYSICKQCPIVEKKS